MLGFVIDPLSFHGSGDTFDEMLLQSEEKRNQLIRETTTCG
jgi:hypothetical protein